MSWLRIDDGYDTHPKLLELTETQRWRWTRLLIHCAKHKTDGRVSSRTLTELGLGRCRTLLINVGLLDFDDVSGYSVHDWSEFNPKDVTKAERQRRWRAKNAGHVDRAVDVSVDEPVDGEVDADVDNGTVYSRVGARARPVPSPTPEEQEPVPEPSLTTPREPRANGTGDEHGPQTIGHSIASALANLRPPEDDPWPT